MTTTTTRTVLRATLAAGFASPALAHPGGHHLDLLATLIHLVTQPDHLALLALAGGAGWIGARALQRRRRDRSPR